MKLNKVKKRVGLSATQAMGSGPNLQEKLQETDGYDSTCCG